MNYQLFINDLKLNLESEVLNDEFTLGMYSTDASLYQEKPIVIVFPTSESEVVKALKIAKDHKVSVLPRGGGTGLAGQTIGHSMVLDFSKFMNQIVEVNDNEKWAIVQPGIARDDLNHHLKQYNLIYAPDPATSSRANVGGMIGNNSSGTKSILYGKTVDHLLELKVALEDGSILHFKNLSADQYQKKASLEIREGEIYRTFKNIVSEKEQEIIDRFPKVMRRVQGYNLDEFAGKKEWNLSKLICGSEGTLGVILEAKINLEPIPKFKSVCVVHFKDFLETIRAVEPMLAFQPSAVEILDDILLKKARTNLTTRHYTHWLEGNPKAVLIVEFYGETEEDVLSRPNLMKEHLQSLNLGYAYPIYNTEQAMSDVWNVRKKGLGLMLGIKSNKKPLAFIEDAAIPIKHLPEYIEEVLDLCKQNETEAAAYAHASVGVIHVRPILDLRLEEDIQRFKNIADGTFKLVQKYGGSWSGEHGDGYVRSWYLKDFFGENVYKAIEDVKQLFDPENRMNPGKIVNAQPIDEKLRYGTQYKDDKIDTVFKYREDLSFENAVHMCSGVGECRKMLGGTMCPSFKATREEEHSTRGRANALRLAMSGQLGEGALTNDRMHEVLDLCLSCKACKSECPSNVDMAKLKSEIYQKRYDDKGVGIRDNFIRQSALFSRIFSGPLATFINFIQGSKLFKWSLEKIAGIDSKRTLPSYAKVPFEKQFGDLFYTQEVKRKKVVLFADTYLNYHEPQVGMAALELLASCGYEVELANVGCCQRPKISHGFLREAKKAGTELALKLDKYFKEGTPVLVCEPSCAASLNDDLPDLIDDEALAKRLKENVMMIDVFLEKEQKAGNLDVDFVTSSENILIHGHCHQKALYGTNAMKNIMKGVEDINVSEIPSGCCGMAGSFGYEKEHFEISKKIGEEILFPAVEKANEETAIVACGFSCRHQIEHFTGKKAVHWVETIRARPKF